MLFLRISIFFLFLSRLVEANEFKDYESLKDYPKNHYLCLKFSKSAEASCDFLEISSKEFPLSEEKLQKINCRVDNNSIFIKKEEHNSGNSLIKLENDLSYENNSVSWFVFSEKIHYTIKEFLLIKSDCGVVFEEGAHLSPGTKLKIEPRCESLIQSVMIEPIDSEKPIQLFGHISFVPSIDLFSRNVCVIRFTQSNFQICPEWLLSETFLRMTNALVKVTYKQGN